MKADALKNITTAILIKSHVGIFAGCTYIYLTYIGTLIWRTTCMCFIREEYQYKVIILGLVNYLIFSIILVTPNIILILCGPLEITFFIHSLNLINSLITSSK